MINILAKVSCGNLTDIPGKLPRLSSEIFTLIEIAIPVLLVIMGTMDLFKGITANKEDEIAKGRKLFIKRLITGVLVFFVFMITKLVVGFIDNKNSSGNLISCMECFINNKCIINFENETRPDYIDCSLNGFNFQIREDGHIPAVSVYGNGIDEVESVDDSLFNLSNSNICPNEMYYKAIYDSNSNSLKIVNR